MVYGGFKYTYSRDMISKGGFRGRGGGTPAHRSRFPFNRVHTKLVSRHCTPMDPVPVCVCSGNESLKHGRSRVDVGSSHPHYGRMKEGGIPM